MAPKPKKTVTVKRTRVVATQTLLLDIRHLIEEARAAVAATVNAGLTMLYWHIGQRINEEILHGDRAGYGEEIVSTLSRQLGWSHFKGIIYLDKPLQRDFYAEMCSLELLLRCRKNYRKSISAPSPRLLSSKREREERVAVVVVRC